MEISSNNISIYQLTKPTKPAEPIPPPDGNIENRKPPSEPSAPVKSVENDRISDSEESQLGLLIDVYS